MLKKLQISGIRSFSPGSEISIEFDEKLTLILGKNGAGKTTIIECLKVKGIMYCPVFRSSQDLRVVLMLKILLLVWLTFFAAVKI